MAITIQRTDSSDPDFITLVKILDAELAELYGAKQSFFDRFNKIELIGHVILAYDDGSAVGCGAFKEFEGCAEIKRMFVLKDNRGAGVASAILNELEQWAFENGFSKCILETGIKQPDAIHLYRKNGYKGIPNYGQYKHVEESVCMEKILK